MRGLYLKFCAFTLILALGGFNTAQLNAQESDLGNWYVFIGSTDLSPKLFVHGELQYRNYNFIGDLEQLLVRTGLGYKFNEGSSHFLLGYGYILSENYINLDDKVEINEHRIYQELVTRQKLGMVNLQHRYRLEERFVESDFKMRARYFLSANLNFRNSEDEIAKTYLSAYNEIFLSLDSPVFDRNRVYGGVGYRFSDALRMELGYMNQLFENSSRDQINIFTFFRI